MSEWYKLSNLHCLCSSVIQEYDVAVVAQPPPTVILYQRHYGTGDHYLLLSILLTFICFFCGTWLSLMCTIPAIFFAISVSDAV